MEKVGLLRGFSFGFVLKKSKENTTRGNVRVIHNLELKESHSKMFFENKVALSAHSRGPCNQFIDVRFHQCHKKR